jgi:putative transposase
VTAHRAVRPIATMCRVLGVSPSGYYAWRQRPLSRRARADVKLSTEIQAIHRESRGTYGVPRIHAELAERGIGHRP